MNCIYKHLLITLNITIAILCVIGTVACWFSINENSTTSLITITSIDSFGIAFILCSLSVRLKRNLGLPCLLIDLIGKCWEWIKTNYFTIIITISLIFVFLYFEKELVETSFSFINKIKENTFGIILLWIFGGALLGTMLYSIRYKSIHNTLSDGRTFFFSLILCSLFSYCWTKYPWKGMIDPRIKNPIEGCEWACIVLFVLYALCYLITPVILYFIVIAKSNKYEQNSSSIQQGSYLSDTPITSKEQDELRFGDHVRALRNKIDEIPNDGTHSIAITGGWGTGKTSFLNLLELELKDSDQYEIMWFNPMKSSKSGNIQNDFFDALENTLSKYKTGFGRRIKYYKELIGAIDNKYVAFLVKLCSIQLEEEKKRINDIIKMIPKKIIIIIDDVDRLKGDEIMQVFRLVGFNAEFDNVIFLTALDKGNVIKALNCDSNYPDKFFETEFPLPDNNRKATSLFVKNTLRRLMADIPMDFLEDQTISKYTNYCLSNLRDATRFINGFVDRVRMIYNKLDVCSFYLLSLIRYKSPSLYEQIKNQEFLENEEVDGKQRLVLKEDFSIKSSILFGITHQLFPQDMTSDSGHQIYQPEFFDDYFNDTSTKSITDAMMMKLLSSKSNEELKQAIESYTKDEISKQYLIEILVKYNSGGFVSSLLKENSSELLITNYYKILGYLTIENGLTYSEGLTPVKVYEGKYAYIDEQGIDIFKIDCDEAHCFFEGVALVTIHDKQKSVKKFSLINKKGESIGQLSYDNARDLHDGLVLVKKDDKWGIINKEGKTVIPIIYDSIKKHDDGQFRVEKDRRWGVFDKEGKAIIALNDVYERDFHEGLACVRKDGKWGFIDKDRKAVIPLMYDFAWDFHEGLASVKKDGKCGLIDNTGKAVIPLMYDFIWDFHEGLARGRIDGKWGFFDKEGKAVIPLIYGSARDFLESLARVEKDGKWGFVGKEGNTVIPFIYDFIWDFHEGLAGVKKYGKWGFVDKEGNTIIPLIYDFVWHFHEGLAGVRKDGKWGFIDKDGNTVIPLIYDNVGDFLKDIAPAEKKGIWGHIDKQGTFHNQ